MRRIFVSSEAESIFWRDGAVSAKLLTPEEIEELTVFYLNEIPPSPMGFHATVFEDNRAYRARVDEHVRSVLWPKLQPYFLDFVPILGTYVVKEHHRPESEVAIHQDWTFVDETRARSINVWCPLVDTDRNNGGLFIFKGSHHLQPAARGPYYPSPLRPLTKVLIEDYLVELPLKAGEAIIYDHSLVHASPENRSDHTRIAVNLVLAPHEEQLIHCFFSKTATDGECEVFAVEQEFFLRNHMKERPEGVPLLGTLYQPPPVLTVEQLSMLRAAAAVA